MSIISKKQKRKKTHFKKRNPLKKSSKSDTKTTWKSFHEQISEISLVGTGTEISDLQEHESDFFARLRKAREENFMVGFEEFANSLLSLSGSKKIPLSEVVDSSKSMSLLLYNREFIWKEILNAMRKKDLPVLPVLYQVSAGFFNDVGPCPEVSRFFEEFVEEFGTSLTIKPDASLIRIMFQSLLAIVRYLLKNSSLSPSVIAEKLIFLLNSKIYPDFIIDFSSSVLSVLLRKDKFSADGVIALILSTDCSEGIVKTFGRAVKTYGSSFFSNAVRVWCHYLNSLQSPDALGELHSFIIDTNPGIKEFEPLVSLSIKKFDECPHLLAPSLSVLLSRKKAKFVGTLALKKLVQKGIPLELFENSDYGREILKNILRLPESKCNSIDMKNLLRNLLSKKCDIAMYFLEDAEKFDFMILPLFVETCGSIENGNILPYVKVLGEIVNGTATTEGETGLLFRTVEFPTDNPDSMNTFPNRILKLICTCEEKKKIALKALLGARPLNKKKTIENLSSLLDDSGISEDVFFTVTILHSLTDSQEFIQILSRHKLIEKVFESIKNDQTCIFGFRVLNYICLCLGNDSLSSDIMDKGWAFNFLIPHVSTFSLEIRHCVLLSLHYLTKSNKEREILKLILEAEKCGVDFHNYRERLRLMGHIERLSDGEDDSLRSHSVLEAIRIRYLISNLTLNLSVVWSPTIKFLITFIENPSSEDIFWKIYFEILSEAYDKITQINNEVYEVDYVRFRNLLLKIPQQCSVRSIEKRNRYFVNNFLDKYLPNEFNSKKLHDEALEELSEEENEDTVEKAMNIDEKEETETQKPFFKQVKSISTSLSHHFSVFSRFPNLRSVYRFSELKDFVDTNLLSDGFAENRKMALQFLYVSDNKISQDQKTLLNSMIEKKSWRFGLRDYAQKSIESCEDYAPITWIVSRLVAGQLKQTRHERRPNQISHRKTIIELISKVNNFDKFFEDILVSLSSSRTDYSELRFDILIIARNYLSISDEIAERAINIIETNFCYENKVKSSKERAKAIQMYTRLLKSLRDQYIWPVQDKINFLKTCLVPLYEDAYKRRLLSKNSFGLLRLIIENSLQWLVLKVNSDKSLIQLIIEDFQTDNASTNRKSEFYKLNLTLACIILKCLFEEEEDDKVTELLKTDESPLISNTNLPNHIIYSINLKAKPEDINLRFTALKSLLDIFPSLNLENSDLDRLCDSIASKIRFKMSEFQCACIKIILADLKKKRNASKKALFSSKSVYKLISKIQCSSQKAKYVEVVLGLLSEEFGNDGRFKGYEVSYEICQNYSELLTIENEDTLSALRPFLFYNAWSEIKRSEFANRRIASSCIMGLIKNGEQEDLTKDCVIPEIISSLSNRQTSPETIHEAITFLQFLILNYSKSIPEMGLLSVITNVQDPDEDFYANMKHLQSHRKSRALKRMAKKIDTLEGDKYNSVIFNFIYPLCSSVLFNESTTKYPEALDGAMEVIGSLASKLDFNRYKKVLSFYLAYEPPPDQNSFAKQKIKIIAKILEAFHFVKENMNFFVSKIFTILDSGQNEDNKASHEVLYLPFVKILMSEGSLSNEHLSRLVVKLAKGLRNRDFPIRERIRFTLNNIALVLGPDYLPYIVSILESTLKRGYEVHVLIYSIKCLVSFCSKNFKIGSLDSLLPNIIKHIKTELFQSVVKEEKSVAKITSKTPEAKKESSFSLIQIMSEFASKSIILNIITPFRSVLVETRNFEYLEKLRRLFKHINNGIIANESLKTLDILAIIHAVLTGKILQDSASNLSSRQTTVIVEFSLLLMTRVLNKGSSIDPRDLAPFPSLIIEKCKVIRDTEVLILGLTIFNVLSYRSKPFRDIVPLNNIFEIVVKSLIVESLFYKEHEKTKYQDLSASLLDAFMSKEEFAFQSDNVESIRVFLQNALDISPMGVKTVKLFGKVLKIKAFSGLKDEILKKLINAYVKSGDSNVVNNVSTSLMAYLNNEPATWIVNTLVQQFQYSIESGRTRSINLVAKILDNESTIKDKVDIVGIFIIAAKCLAEEKSLICIESLRKLFEALKCTDAEFKSISELLKAWVCEKDENLVIVGAKTVALISKTDNAKLRQIILEFSDDLKQFVEKEDDDLSNRVLNNHIKVDFLTALFKTSKKNGDAAFDTWMLEYVNKHIMSGSSLLRKASIDLLSLIAGRISLYWNNAALDKGRGLLRRVLLNLIEVLKLNISVNEGHIFEKISITLVYLSKMLDPQLLFGKLIGVARYEVANLSFSMKRRELLFMIVGTLVSKYPLSPNMLRSILKMARAVVDEMNETVEELYSKLENSTDDPESLKQINNARNRVDILESKMKRKAPSRNEALSPAKRKKS